MKYVKAPSVFSGRTPTLYLAGPVRQGGWRERLADALEGTSWTVLDPVRDDYADLDGPQRREQIEWGLAHLRRATAALFWFAPPTACSITLLELGFYAAGDQTMFVGVHPRFSHEEDVRMRLAVLRPQLRLGSSLDGLAEQIVQFSRESACASMTA